MVVPDHDRASTRLRNPLSAQNAAKYDDPTQHSSPCTSEACPSGEKDLAADKHGVDDAAGRPAGMDGRKRRDPLTRC